MPWHAHYFILNEAHEPVEVTLDEWCRWRGANDPIKRTDVGRHARVITLWQGMTDDESMPGAPKFMHLVEGPGVKDEGTYSATYDAAIARHDRIAEWLRKREGRFAK
jgi:hypothetical protein